MWRILPDFCKIHRRYEKMGLRDLCQQIHEAYRKYDLARLTTEVYLSDMVPAMKPSDAYAKMAHREAERVDRSEEHTSELQSLMRISYAVFCLKKKKQVKQQNKPTNVQQPQTAPLNNTNNRVQYE